MPVWKGHLTSERLESKQDQQPICGRDFVLSLDPYPMLAAQKSKELDEFLLLEDQLLPTSL
jgi:hypothetical protein